MIIAVASANPAKISAVEQALNQLFTDVAILCEGFATESGVAAQPMSAEETLQGALNRLTALTQAQPQADYCVALEAGLEGDSSFAWIAISHKGKISKSRSASLPLPPAVIQALMQGAELGDVMDKLFATHNVKQQGGAIAMLTNHKLTRSQVYQQAVILAMIPFLQAELFNN